MMFSQQTKSSERLRQLKVRCVHSKKNNQASLIAPVTYKAKNAGWPRLLQEK